MITNISSEVAQVGTSRAHYIITALAPVEPSGIGTSAVIDNTGGYADAVTPGGGLQRAGP
ncbi:MAG: hypothetical protein GY939_24335 [Actinomycetia bacterium]|nr:hypothetical protein [Actinomycetes bacterium]